VLLVSKLSMALGIQVSFHDRVNSVECLPNLMEQLFGLFQTSRV
jgi:hypothetical protein